MPDRTLEVFVGHRFTPEFNDDFRAAVNSALSSFKGPLEVLYADMMLVSGHILGQKIQPMIDDCFFCIFDISDVRKPNVFIELGYAYGRGKHVVLTSKGSAPSDLAGYDVLTYSSFKELEAKLKRYLPSIVAEALPTFAEPTGAIPPQVTTLLYSNWRNGSPTKKQAIYDVMERDEADRNLSLFVGGRLAG